MVQRSPTWQTATICPPLKWRPLVWLTTSPVAPIEVWDELRASLFNRMSAVIASAVVMFPIAVALALRHPHTLFVLWAVLDGLASLVRVVGAVAILRHKVRHPGEAAPDNLFPDLDVGAGLVWCAILGCGTGLCLASGDIATSVMGCLLGTTTMGAQCARVPGAPRLLLAQLVCISLPLAIGGCFAPDVSLAWSMITAPAYLFALFSINTQLHQDYVEMIVGRHESRLMALRCPLTGLANRRAFDRAIATALATASHRSSTVVLSLDLDGFKTVNDVHGHLAGDLLLRQVAERLLRHVPAGSLTARLGGDEFAILARGAAANAAEQLACAVLAALREPIMVSGLPATVGVSIGLARATAVSTPDRLLGEADQALYTAKRGGKNRYHWFTAEPDPLAADPAAAGTAGPADAPPQGDGPAGWAGAPPHDATAMALSGGS